MKVFSGFDRRPAPSQTNPQRGKLRSARPDLSPDEIRQRLAKGLKKDINPGANPNINKGRQVSEFMSGKPARKITPPATAPMSAEEAQNKAQDLMLKSDVGANDPNDPATLGKLKNALKMGSFNFSDKEKSALSKILGMGKNG